MLPPRRAAASAKFIAGIGLAFLLEQSQRPEGGMGFVPNHDMVVKFNLKSIGR